MQRRRNRNGCIRRHPAARAAQGRGGGARPSWPRAGTDQAAIKWKLDRFSRNRYDSAHYKRILKNNRIHVVSVTEPISNAPDGMTEYYSAELAEKVSRGHKENALKAKFNGGPVPLGYRIDSEHHY